MKWLKCEICGEEFSVVRMKMSGQLEGRGCECDKKQRELDELKRDFEENEQIIKFNEFAHLMLSQIY